MNSQSKVTAARNKLLDNLFALWNESEKKYADIRHREWILLQQCSKSIICTSYGDKDVETLLFALDYIMFNDKWVEAHSQDEVEDEIRAYWGNRWAAELTWNIEVSDKFKAGPVIGGFVEVVNRFSEKRYVSITDIADLGWDIAYYDANPCFLPSGPAVTYQWKKKYSTESPVLSQYDTDEMPF